MRGSIGDINALLKKLNFSFKKKYRVMKKLESHIIKVSDKLSFHFLDIEDYDSDFINMIDNYILSICNGVLGDNDIEMLKKELKRWFQDKDSTKIIGFIAEFFCHLYLNQNNFEQHFIFKNLEETNSMKKGFDGVYQSEDNIWLYESKSSLPDTKDATHNANISEAFNDINKKINGTKLDSSKNPIDPWSNAINHASLLQVKPNITLINNLNQFKKRFFKDDFEDIKNFNVIPSSTIFMEGNWKPISKNEIEQKLTKLTNRYNYNKMNIICINKKSVNNFLKYING